MNNKKLSKYTKGSSLMNISIEYNGEKITFNMYEELQINENTINAELKEQPSYYSFIGMLHKKLIRQAAEKEKSSERLWAKAYTKIKGEIDPNTNRVTSNELAKEKANLDIKYKKGYSSYLVAKEQADTIGICLKSFEQRKDLIQTIAANLRREQ